LEQTLNEIINIYCDESCHLPADGQKAMVLGGLQCHSDDAAAHNKAIADLKKKYGMPPFFEIKWNSASSFKHDLYAEIVEYFFSMSSLGFRAWVVEDKTILKHEHFQQTHDDWYYKMYYYLIRDMIDPSQRYRIFIDLKDTRGRLKIRKLHEVLSTTNHDSSMNIIKDMQHVHSHDVGLMQLADLLIGAVSYQVRGLSGNKTKESILELLKRKSGRTLRGNTPRQEKKFNLCFWQPNLKEDVNV